MMPRTPIRLSTVWMLTVSLMMSFVLATSQSHADTCSILYRQAIAFTGKSPDASKDTLLIRSSGDNCSALSLEVLGWNDERVLNIPLYGQSLRPIHLPDIKRRVMLRADWPLASTSKLPAYSSIDPATTFVYSPAEYFIARRTDQPLLCARTEAEAVTCYWYQAAEKTAKPLFRVATRTNLDSGRIEPLLAKGRPLAVSVAKAVPVEQEGRKVWRVNRLGTGDFDEIQDAIERANAGDTVLIRSGRYQKPLVINKAITLTSEGGDGWVYLNTPTTAVTLETDSAVQFTHLNLSVEIGPVPSTALHCKAAMLSMHDVVLRTRNAVSLQADKACALSVSDSFLEGGEGVRLLASPKASIKASQLVGSEGNALTAINVDGLEVTKSFLASAKGAGIKLVGGRGIRLEHNYLQGNQRAAIEAEGVKELRVANNRLQQSEAGVLFRGVMQQAVLERNRFSDLAQGVVAELDPVSQLRLAHNIFAEIAGADSVSAIKVRTQEMPPQAPSQIHLVANKAPAAINLLDARGWLNVSANDSHIEVRPEKALLLSVDQE